MYACHSQREREREREGGKIFQIDLSVEIDNWILPKIIFGDFNATPERCETENNFLKIPEL